MIEETVIVTRTDNGLAWIRRQQAGACGGCAQLSTCGTAILAEWLPKREFEVECSFNVQAGDQVRVLINDSHVLLSSVLLYLAPLLAMLAGVSLAMAFLPSRISESWLPEIALTILLLAFWLIHRLQPLFVMHLSRRPEILEGSKH